MRQYDYVNYNTFVDFIEPFSHVLGIESITLFILLFLLSPKNSKLKVKASVSNNLYLNVCLHLYASLNLNKLPIYTLGLRSKTALFQSHGIYIRRPDKPVTNCYL